MAGHYFSKRQLRWMTETNYNKFKQHVDLNPYGEIKTEYDEIKTKYEALRRTFE